MRKIFITAIFLLLSIHHSDVQDNLIQLKTALHLSPTVSDGEYTFEQIVKTAKDQLV